jgi:molybdenum cofactor cytidylyltransferase
MGQPKLLARLGRRTVLEAVIANHLASSVGRVWAVVPGWVPGFGRIAGELCHERLSFLAMKQPCPMSDSLKAGWARAIAARRPDAIMISLADKPLVRPDTIDRLIAAYEASTLPVCLPTYGSAWGHPVILSTTLDREVMQLAGDRGALGVLEAHRGEIEEVAVETDEVIFDIDSAEDLAQLRTRLDSCG